jgi:PAS domain S-box-containing protein
MAVQGDKRSFRFKLFLPRVAGWVVLGIGLLVMAGWIFNIPLLRSLHPDFVSMKANTALSFMLLGLSLLLMERSPEIALNKTHPLARRISIAAALGVLLVGSLNLLQYLLKADLGIDELLFRDEPGAVDTFAPGRMALNTSIGFVLASASLILLHTKRSRGVILSQLLALFIVLSSLMPILGYKYDVAAFYSYGDFTQMALHTAVAFLIVGLGVMAGRPLEGIVSVISSSGRAGYLARRLIPASVLLPIALLWGWLWLSPDGFDRLASDPSLFITVLISLLVGVSWKISDSINTLEKKKSLAETELDNWHQLMQYIIRHDPNAIAVHDTELRYVFVSERYLSDYNLKHKDIIGKPHYEVFPDIPDRWKEVHRRALAGEVIKVDEDEFIRQDGTTDYTRWECRPWYRQGEEVGGIILYTEVITNRKKAEKALQEKNEFIHTVLDNLPIGVALNTINEGSAMYMNKKFEEIYGWPREELTDIENFFRRVYPEPSYRETLKQKIMADMQSGDPERMHWENILTTRQDGKQRIIDAKNIPLLEQNTMVSTVLDLTKQKRAELDLRELNQQLLRLVSTIKELARVPNREQIRLIMKTAAQELKIADAEKFAESIVSVFSTGKQDPQDMETLWPKQHSPGELDQQILQTLEDAASIALENVGLYEDLEQRVRSRTLELEAANKELEAFTYSVSHDLRAPLRAIDGFSMMLEEDYAGVLDENGHRICDIIRNNSRKMGQLIDDLLAFSRLSRAEIQRSKIEMKSLAESVFQELAKNPPRQGLAFEVSDLPPAWGDAAMIKQVWVNLVSNALKFSSKMENPVIRISGEVKNGVSYYRIEDNGVGFDMQYAGSLFGVFQRLHPASEFEGTGVGLAIVERVVHRHGGAVSAWSEMGKGARFEFTLPVRNA